MNKLKISALMLSVFMVACSSDDEIVNNEEKTIEEISAEIIQPADLNGTRLVIGGNPGDKVRPMTWRADDPRTAKKNEADAIYVYDTKGHASRFVYSEDKASKAGVFKRDVAFGEPIVDIKDALSVPFATGSSNAKQGMPASADAEFKYMNTTVYHQGAENAPMYGIFENGVLKFKPVTGIIEIEVKNLKEIQEKIKVIKADLSAKNPNKKPADNMAIKLTAYDKDGKVVKTSANSAKLNDTKDGLTFVAASNFDFVNVMVNDVSLFNEPTDNRFYFPMIAGEYSKFEISIHYPNAYKNPPITETVNITPKAGTGNLKIDKMLYSISKSFALM